jgi:hypothetical protein
MQIDKSGLLPSLFILFFLAFVICAFIFFVVMSAYWVAKGRPKRVDAALCAILAFFLSFPIWIRVLDFTRLKFAEASMLREAQKNTAEGQPNKQVWRLLHQGWSDFDNLVYDPTDAEAAIPSDAATARKNEAARITEGFVISTPLGGHFYRVWTDYGQ